MAAAFLLRLACGLTLLLPFGASMAADPAAQSGAMPEIGMQGFKVAITDPQSVNREIQDVRRRIQQLLVAVDQRIARMSDEPLAGDEVVGDEVAADEAAANEIAATPGVTDEPAANTETFAPAFDATDLPSTLPATTIYTANVDNTRWSPIGYLKMLLRNITHGDGWTLLLVALAGVLALVWLLLPSQRPREYQDGSDAMDFSVLALDRKSGVTFTADDTVTTIDVDDEPWYSQPVMDEQDPDLAGEQDVDLITQSDVYLAYGRTMQAIQVLLEEYEKPDSDRFVLATKLIHAYRRMGEDSERNDSMQSFITRLNQDIDLFSGTEWDRLRQDLDSLRREEQVRATGSAPGRNGRIRPRDGARNMEVAYDSRKTA